MNLVKNLWMVMIVFLWALISSLFPIEENEFENR